MTHPQGVNLQWVDAPWGGFPWGREKWGGEGVLQAQLVHRAPTVVARKGRPKRKVVR